MTKPAQSMNEIKRIYHMDSTNVVWHCSAESQKPIIWYIAKGQIFRQIYSEWYKIPGLFSAICNLICLNSFLRFKHGLVVFDLCTWRFCQTLDETFHNSTNSYFVGMIKKSRVILKLYMMLYKWLQILMDNNLKMFVSPSMKLHILLWMLQPCQKLRTYSTATWKINHAGKCLKVYLMSYKCYIAIYVPRTAHNIRYMLAESNILYYSYFTFFV